MNKESVLNKMDKESIEWVQFDFVDKKSKKKIPKWARCCGRNSKGDILIPAGLLGNELLILTCLGFDGIPAIVSSDNHLYVPSEWAKKEYIHQVKEIEILEEKANKFFNNKVSSMNGEKNEIL